MEVKTVEHKYCVYIHTNKINNKAYIGITNNTINRWSHGDGYLRKDKNNQYYQPVFANAIKKYGWDNFEHIIFADNLTEEAAKHIEILLIALYRTNCNRYNPSFGYNMTDGGEGCTGRVFSKDTIKKMSLAKIGKPSPRKGVKLTEKEKQKMSDSRKGKHSGQNNPFYGQTHTDEAKDKIRSYASNRPDEVLDKIRKSHMKPIVQLDKNGVLIKEFCSASVAEQETGIDAGHINACCNHKPYRKTAGGYQWFFTTEYYKNL